MFYYTIKKQTQLLPSLQFPVKRKKYVNVSVLRPKKSLTRRHLYAVTSANYQSEKSTLRRYLKFSTFFLIDATPKNRGLSSRSNLAQKFCIRASIKTSSTMQKHRYALRLWLSRRSFCPKGSRRRSACRLRRRALRRRRLILRRSYLLRRRYQKNQRQWARRRKQSTALQKHNSSKVNKSARRVKGSRKQVKKLRKTTKYVKKSRGRGVAFRGKGKGKLRRWEKRRNYTTFLSFTARSACTGRLFRRTAKPTRASLFRKYLLRKNQQLVKRLRRLVVTQNSKHEYARHRMRWARRQLRTARIARRASKQSAVRARGLRKRRLVLRHYVRYQCAKRASLLLRARFLRWSFFVRHKRAPFPVRRLRKKSLRLRRGIARRRAIFSRTPVRILVPASIITTSWRGLRRISALRKAQRRVTATASLRKSSQAEASFTNKDIVTTYALMRNIAVLYSNCSTNNVETGARAYSQTSRKTLQKAFAVQASLESTATHPHVAPALLCNAAYRKYSNSVRITAALRARTLYLRGARNVIFGARLAARKSLLSTVRRARLYRLLKARTWQKIFRKARFGFKLGKKRLVRHSRRRALLRRFRAALSHRYAKTLLGFRRAVHARIKVKRPGVKNFVATKQLGRPRRLKKRLLQRGSIKRRRFRHMRRAARQLRRRAGQKLRRHVRRYRRRRFLKFRSSWLRRRHKRTILLRFKFKRAPYLLEHRVQREGAYVKTFSKVRASHKLELRSHLQFAKPRRLKLLDRYSCYTRFHTTLLPRRIRVKRHWVRLGKRTLRSSKKQHRQQSVICATAQVTSAVNRVPTRLQLFAAQLFANKNLGVVFSAPAFVNENTAKLV